jgi:hypothetical protein
MKRATLLLALILFLAAIFAAQAQEEPKSSVKSVSILKVLSHTMGYKVLYLKSSMEVGEIYIPYEWFKAAGKAEVVFGGDRSYPYFSVFYKDGAFSFIRLYLRDNVKDISWGRLAPQEGDRAKFDVDELALDF